MKWNVMRHVRAFEEAMCVILQILNAGTMIQLKSQKKNTHYQHNPLAHTHTLNRIIFNLLHFSCEVV